MRPIRPLAVITVVACAVLTAINCMYYANRIRELNNVVIPGNIFPENGLLLGARAVQNVQTEFWLVEAVILVLTIVVLAAASWNRK